MNSEQAESGDRRIHAPARGILCLVGGGLAFTSNDAIVKSMTASLPVGEMMSIRGFLSLLLIVIICAPEGLGRNECGASEAGAGAPLEAAEAQGQGACARAGHVLRRRAPAFGGVLNPEPLHGPGQREVEAGAVLGA